MLLKDRWDILTQNHKSPKLFLDFCFYWAIGASLQRRVWLGSHRNPIIPALYIMLVGGPGVGKGIIVDFLNEIMRYHKFRPANSSNDNELERKIAKMEASGASPEVLETLRQARQAMEDIKMVDNKKAVIRELQLFPVCADCSTFQAIIDDHAASVRTFHCKTPSPMAPSGLYTYHSMCMILEEASSMFHEKSNQIVQYLLKTYNAQDYEYKTRHQGKDFIKRCSLAFIAGTTPEFMRQVFGAEIFGDGFAARNFFIYGPESRFETWEIPEENLEQKEARDCIYRRLKELSQLFGQCNFNPEARQFMDYHYKGKEMLIKKKNPDPKLQYYYARHNLHIQKMAMCIHFAENDSLDIGLESLEQAQSILCAAEETMHMCLDVKGRNPIGSLGRAILKFLEKKTEPVNFVDIYTEFVDEGDSDEIQSALDYLCMIKKIKQDGMEYYKV